MVERRGSDESRAVRQRQNCAENAVDLSSAPCVASMSLIYLDPEMESHMHG